MNNKEKREYISCLHLAENIRLCTDDEMVRIDTVLKKCPNSFFKYKKFDKWTFDIIKNKYAYLSPIKDLDDPFDCLSDFETNEIVNMASKTVTEKAFGHIIKETKLPISEEGIDLARQYKDCFKPGDDFEQEKILRVLMEHGCNEEQSLELVSKYQNLINAGDSYNETGIFDTFGKMYLNPNEHFGVCSLSEIKNNKVMWSLYGKKYTGCCIEYQIKPDFKARRFLFPVIYSRKANNNFAEKLIDTIYGETIRQINNMSGFKSIINESVGAIYEPLCTKDIDWSYQKEWRLIGNKGNHFKDVDIKAVYLGFDVKKTNEEKMLRYAKKFRFDLYKMRAPNGKKIVSFKKLYSLKK